MLVVAGDLSLNISTHMPKVRWWLARLFVWQYQIDQCKKCSCLWLHFSFMLIYVKSPSFYGKGISLLAILIYEACRSTFVIFPLAVNRI